MDEYLIVTSQRLRRFLLIILLLAGCTIHGAAQAPVDNTSDKITVNIVFAGYIESDANTEAGRTKLIDSVILEQDKTYMYCDSAYLNQETNNVEAFGAVHIVQPNGTNVESDYLRYTGNSKEAYLQGNVALTNGKDNLWSEELFYNLGTRMANYNTGGTLQSGETTVSSNIGQYNLNSKDARFTGEVYVNDPKYTTVSDDLGYNTTTEVVVFYGPSVVNNEKSELRTSSGVYDTKQGIAHFTQRTEMRDREQYLEGDSVDYNRNTGFGVARGNVIARDTTQKITLYSGWGAYNEQSRIMKAYIKPVLKKQNGNDSIFVRGDTLYAAPVSTMKRGVLDVAPQAAKADAAKPAKRKAVSVTQRDTTATTGNTQITEPDTSGPRYFIAYHHVMIWSDSLQGVCDSLSYSQEDSLMRMMYDPVAWSRESQITGDTILVKSDSSEIRDLFVPNNALLVSQSGPEKAGLFDQIQGKELRGFMKNNAIDYMVVKPQAESIHYSKDKQDRYIGVSQASGDIMRAYFKDRQIAKIIYEREARQTFSPLSQVSLPTMKLSRFKWLIDRRPKSREQLFR